MDQPLLETAYLTEQPDGRAEQAQRSVGLAEELLVVSETTKMKMRAWTALGYAGRLFNFLLLLLSLVHVPLILLFTSIPWWNTVRTVTMGNGETITTHAMEKDFDETLAAFNDSDTNWLIAFYMKMNAVAFP